MRAFLRSLAVAAALLAVAPSALAQVGPPRNQSFPFAVGGGFYAVSDTGQTSDVSGFKNTSFSGFGEVVLETGVFLQFRYQHFTLPGAPVVPAFGSPTSAPDVKVNAGIMSVGYLFREVWWDAGFVGGVGAYSMKPDAPSADQATMDAKETVIGWHAGLITMFHVSARVDLRLEATAYLLRTDATHKPITLGGGLAYHF